MGAGMVGTGVPELASVLFTDVVGSTELRQRLGEEAADRLQQTHDELMARSIDACGGRLIKGVGDGVLAVFDAAADAVAAAVAVQQAVEAHGRSEPDLRFGVRVGVSAGDVVARDGDVFGTVVVEASRLCGAAQAGQVLAADLVRMLARGRGGFVFEPVGELLCKGLEEPVPACQVLWEPVSAPLDVVLPFPPLLAPPTATGYVGRAELRGRLEELWGHARAGHGAVGVLLAGEPGVGKTRTAAEAARAAYASGGIVLFGRCDETLASPYQPFVEALDWQSRHDPGLGLGRLAGELTRLVPDLPARVEELPAPVDSDPGVEQHRLFEAVASWLAEASHPRGLVLVLDDLQWAGEPTLALLTHVLRTVEVDDRAQLLVIGTYRDTDVDRSHPLSAMLGELRRIGHVERLAVDNLTVDEVVALVEAAAGHELDEDALRLARRVHAETEGNPFFVGEVLRHFIEAGAVRLESGRWQVTEIDHVDVPEGVRDVVGRRLSRLSPAANDVLGMAAVLGRDVDVEVLGRLVDGGVDVVLDALDEALRSRLVEETGPDRVRFTHALVGATLYEELSTPRRRRAHGHVLGVLEQLRPGDVESLAHHAVQAGPVGGSLEPAVRHCVAAGAEALGKRAHAAARDWFRQALELGDEHPPDDHRLMLAARSGLGQALHQLSDPAAREMLLQAGRDALEAGELDLAVSAAVANSRLMPSIVGAVDTDKANLLESILRRLGDEVTNDRARVLALLASELTHDPGQAQRRLSLADEAVEVAQRLGDEGLETWVLVITAVAVMVPSRTWELSQSRVRVVDLADRTGDPALRCVARLSAAVLRLGVGDLSGARRLTEAAARLGAEEASPALAWMARSFTVQFLAYEGRIAAAREANDACLLMGEQIREPDAAVWWGAFLGGVAQLEWTAPALTDTLETFADQYPDLVTWRAAHVLVLSQAGRHDEAAALLVRHGLSDAARVPDDYVTLAAWGELTQAAFELHDADLGAQLMRLLEEHRYLWVQYSVFCLYPVELALGLAAAAAGHWDEAVASTRRAQELLREQGMRSHEPLASLYLTRILIGRGRPDDLEQAHTVATDGVKAATSMGMEVIAAELRQLLDGLTPAGVSPYFPDGEAQLL